MSYSINKLLKGLTDAVQPVQQEVVQQPYEKGTLYNPDVPDDYEDGDMGYEKYEKDYRLHGESQYNKMNSLDNIKTQQSGDYFRLNEHINRPKQLDKFYLDGSIDPNQKKLTSNNPEGAMPLQIDAYGDYDVTFDLRDDVDTYTTTDNVRMYQRANQSFVNYKDRFNLPQPVM